MRKPLWVASIAVAAIVSAIAYVVSQSSTADSEPVIATRDVAVSPEVGTDFSALSIESDSGQPDARVSPQSVPNEPPQSTRSLDATLLVTVVSSTDDTPIPGVRVSVHDRDGMFERLAQGEPTSLLGQTEIAVPSGFALLLVAEEHTPGVGTALNQVAPLKPGERREYRFAVRPGDDERAFVRVVACGRGTPIEGAVVQVCRAIYIDSFDEGARHLEQVIHEAVTDARGQCDLAYTSGRDVFLRVRAAGMAPVGANIDAERMTETDPQIVCLERGASLTITVSNASGTPLAGAVVRISASQSARDVDPRGWNKPPGVDESATTDADGIARLADLPVGVLMLACLFVGDRTNGVEDVVLSLAPGGAPELKWVVGAGCRIDGTVSDETAQPVANVEIRLRRPSEDVGEDISRTRSSFATSNEEGRFTFEDVAPGDWIVELGPHNFQSGPNARAIAIEPVTIRIEPQARSHSLAVRVYHDLFITGRVFLPPGWSGTNIVVEAREEGDRFEVRTLSAPDGTFSVGPLIPGRYELWSSGFPTRVRADAGASGVELRLVVGGSLRTQVVDADSGDECEASVTIVRRDADRPESIDLARDWMDGYETEGLLPGRYDVIAWTLDRRYGELHDVIVQDGRETRDVIVRVSKGGELRLRCDAPPDGGTFEIVHDGRTLRVATLRRGQETSHIVPAGALTVRFTGVGTSDVREQSFELPAGETRTVVFGE